MSRQASLTKGSPQTTPEETLARARDLIFSQQHADGYWWYTLEANDSINAEYLMLLKYLGLNDKNTEAALCRWILSNQNDDGSWSLYYKDKGDLSSTVECYMALKLCGFLPAHEQMAKARAFILAAGGITKIRVFSRVHLALFGLVSWTICPNMPVALIQFPEWSPVNIYEFSSWARACIVPLLVIMDQRKSRVVKDFTLDELHTKNESLFKADWSFDKDAGPLSIENAFIQVDKALKVADRLKLKPLRNSSLKKCASYIREHIGETEDIYPAMFYGILALVSLGYDVDDPSVAKALEGLKSFHVRMDRDELLAVPFHAPSNDNTTDYVYQQCCISPVWDTAWAGVALLDAGVLPSDERLIKTARWLITKQITDVVGDWGIKNPEAKPGGWSFEFNNKHYPDVDDSIEVLKFLSRISLPYAELKAPIERGVHWLISMQSKNGGFAAFDKDNNLEVLNKLPFSDHGACLDPATVDITARMITFLVGVLNYDKNDPVILRAANFIRKNQEKDGSFFGRWGVNYIYGTWTALEALATLGLPQDALVVSRAVNWLKTIQNEDGGFGESCDSYRLGQYVSTEESVASQTAWALMGLTAAGHATSDTAKRAAEFLISTQNAQGSWDEKYFTGTGFPGHFYIRYHGYRHFFPLMGMAKWLRCSYTPLTSDVA